MSNFHLITHFHNEEMLLPYWIKNHLPLFETATLINHRSTDRSIEIIKELAPHWEIVDTKLENFSAAALEPEVQYWESQSNAQYKLTLNTTEFLFDKDFRYKIEEMFKHVPLAQALGIKSVVMVDKEETSLTDEPLSKTRTWGYIDPGHVRRRRYIHRMEHGHYHLGRHGTNLPHINMEGSFIQWFGFSPWPQCKQRKLQIKSQCTAFDIANKLGFEHHVDDGGLTEMYLQHLALSGNLLEDPDYLARYNEYI